MIGLPPPIPATNSDLSAVAHQGLKVITPDGKPGQLAVIDEAGNVVESGPHIAEAVWGVVITSYRQFMIGKGHLRVHSSPPGKAAESKSAA